MGIMSFWKKEMKSDNELLNSFGYNSNIEFIDYMDYFFVQSHTL